MFKEYWEELLRMLLRPILFFTKMPKSEWSDKPVTFVAITSAILSAFITLIVFITTFIPIGSTLLEKVPPMKVVIIVPVMAVLGFMFFVITYAILFGVILAMLLGLFLALGALIYASASLMGGKGDFKTDLSASFYSSGVFVLFSAIVLSILLTKSRLMDFTNFAVGYNMLYSFSILYLYGVQAIICRKEHNLPKWKAFACALVPALFLVLVGIVANKVILPKIGPWIS